LLLSWLTFQSWRLKQHITSDTTQHYIQEFNFLQNKYVNKMASEHNQYANSVLSAAPAWHVVSTCDKMKWKKKFPKPPLVGYFNTGPSHSALCEQAVKVF
jgi:hypothetical protein